MASNDGKTFPPRKWYRRVPFLSAKPIQQRLTAPKVSTPGNVEHQNEDKLPMPELQANWLSILTFNWLGRLLRTGWQKIMPIAWKKLGLRDLLQIEHETPLLHQIRSHGDRSGRDIPLIQLS
ncbi:hypothetical protein LB505_011684 [Fusarium chuoi]|nr:hypothetical protein LB505_011684 [Fusarium chuoi]